jgi:hypothetical protein
MRTALAVGVACTPLIAGCQLLFPTVAEPSDAGGDARDSASDVGREAGDGGRDAPPSVYNALDGGNWQVYSLGLTSPFSVGGAFDGRYVYFAPNGGVVQRHDTHAPFAMGWSSFDPAKLGAGASDTFSGAAFDGKFVYFVGYTFQSPETHAVFARYDPTSPFGDPSSWKEFDLTAADPRAVSFSGAAFDGHYLYFAPLYNGFVERFDTTGVFQDPASWVGTDLGSTGNPGFEGAIFDGRYVYFVPHYHSVLTDAGWVEAMTASGTTARFDTKGTFTSPGAWTRFDTTKLDKNASGFSGGVFDGRYVYFVPYVNYVAVAVRYDTTTTAFDVESSWEKFDCTLALTTAAGFVSGAFDGRYVYFAPDVNSANSPTGVLLRYDTTHDFRAAASWSSYDIANLSANAIGYAGTVFDGEYLYFVPYSSGIVAQFHARTTPFPQRLPTFPGSFL